MLAGLAIAARSPGKGSPGGPPPESAAAVGAPDAESSAWYCTGQSTAAGQLAPGSVILTNTGGRTVTGTISAVTDTGAKVETGVSVAARSQRIAAIPVPTTGSWISEAVVLSGGGVAVTQATDGPTGWSESPCLSSTSQQWYFPGGVTTGSDALFIALFNPTSTPDVVDVGFVTPTGSVHPINFQGIVLEPGQMQVESVAPFVQEKSNVSTIVVTRTGRLVASELQLSVGERIGTGDRAGFAAPRGRVDHPREHRGRRWIVVHRRVQSGADDRGGDGAHQAELRSGGAVRGPGAGGLDVGAPNGHADPHPPG